MNVKLIAIASLFGLGATATLASTTVEDSDGSGNFSMEEMLTVYPALTDEIFAAVDVNEDGAIDAEELAVAQEAGVLASE